MRSLFALPLAALAVAGLSAPAHAAYLPGLVNLNFLQLGNPFSGGTHKQSFGGANPTGWTGGGGLIFIGQAGSADDGEYLSVYGPFPKTNPGGGNFVEADGNPDYEGSFNYMVHGLTAGTTYQISFYQAAGQQQGFGNGLPTTNQWIVSLGTTGLSKGNFGNTDPLYGPVQNYYSTDPNASIAASDAEPGQPQALP